jgi:hypothetical protein
MTTKESASQATKKTAPQATETKKGSETQAKQDQQSASSKKADIEAKKEPQSSESTRVAKGTTSPLDLLLDRLEEDVREEREIDEEIDALRDEKKHISDRVRDGIKYFAHLMDSASPEQQERLTALGVKPKSGKRELNRAAQIALSIMAEQKEPITNEDLYNKYLEIAQKEAGLPDTYPQFNVHLRAPERSGVLKRTIKEGMTSSREALISYHPEASQKYAVKKG